MEEIYQEATKELTRFQKAVIIATLIVIITCSAALFVAVLAQIFMN